MDDLDKLANSRSHNVPLPEAPMMAQSVLRWPLVLLGIIVLPPLVFGLPFFLAGSAGHGAGIFLLLGYVYLVPPVIAPLGLLVSLSAAYRYPDIRDRALLVGAVFLAITIISWLAISRGLPGPLGQLF
jgi:hypothetical protein